jgi:hypothetical protein
VAAAGVSAGTLPEAENGETAGDEPKSIPPDEPSAFDTSLIQGDLAG